MKKIILSLAMVAMSAVAVNAQLLVGGSLEMNANGALKTDETIVDGKSKIVKTSQNSTFGFSINPTVGYIINDFEIGVSVGLGGNFANEKVHPVVDLKPVTDKLATAAVSSTFNWSVSPYARYYFFQKNGWGVAIQGNVSVGGSKLMDIAYKPVEGVLTKEDIKKAKEKEAKAEKELAEKGIKDIDSYVNWSVSFAPVVTYTVKEHWVLVSRLGFLGLGVYGNVNKFGTVNTKENTKDVTTTSDATFKLNLLQNGSAELISFGCVYKF